MAHGLELEEQLALLEHVAEQLAEWEHEMVQALALVEGQVQEPA